MKTEEEKEAIGNWQLAAHESVAVGGSTNDMAAPEWSNQTYLTLQLLRPRARLTLQLSRLESCVCLLWQQNWQLSNWQLRILQLSLQLWMVGLQLLVRDLGNGGKVYSCKCQDKRIFCIFVNVVLNFILNICSDVM